MLYPDIMSNLKAQIRKVMIDHLKSKGYPNMTSKQILAELKPLWIKLEEAKLLQPNWNYNQFVEIAHAEEHYHNLREAIQEEMLRHFGRKPG